MQRMNVQTSCNTPYLIWYFNSGKRSALDIFFLLNWRGEKTLHFKVLFKSYFNIPPFVSWRTRLSLSKYRCSIKTKNHKFVSEEVWCIRGGMGEGVDKEMTKRNEPTSVSILLSKSPQLPNILKRRDFVEILIRFCGIFLRCIWEGEKK